MLIRFISLLISRASDLLIRREVDSMLKAQNRRYRQNVFEPQVWEAYAMTEEQFKNAKRDSFRKHAPQSFRFLVTEFGYDGPKEEFNAFEDYFFYENVTVGRRVELINQYYGSDYGYDVTIKRIKPNQYLTKDEDRCTADYVLQHYQDPQQVYLGDSAEKIRTDYRQLLTGEKWHIEWHPPLTNELCKQRFVARKQS